MQQKTHYLFARVASAIILGSIVIGLMGVMPYWGTTGPTNTQGNFQVTPHGASAICGSIQLNATQIYRGDTLAYNVTVGQIDLPFAFLNWSIHIQNNTGSTWQDLSGITPVPSPIMAGSWAVPSSATVGTYQVLLSITNDSYATNTNVTEQFTVLNNLPQINTITSSVTSAYRGDSFNVSVSATDTETSPLTVNIHYRDTQGIENVIAAQWISTNLYSAEYTIPMTAPVGSYSFWAVVSDGLTTVTSASINIAIQNNLPSIDLASGLTINNQNVSTGVSSVRISDTLYININATDPENTVAFVELNFQNHNDVTKWHNYTIDYQNSQQNNITISAADLGVGSWDMYVVAIDADGGVWSSVQDTAPISVVITQDNFTLAAPIVGFLLGIPAGFAIGIAVVLSRRGRQTSKASKASTKIEGVSPATPKSRKGGMSGKVQESKEMPSQPQTGTIEEDKTPSKRKIRRRIE